MDVLGAQIPFGHLPHSFGQQQQRTRQLCRQQRSQQHGAKYRQEQSQGQRANEHALHAGSRQCPLLVFAIGRLHQYGVLQQFLRHRLQQLQNPRLALQSELRRAHQGVGNNMRRP